MTVQSGPPTRTTSSTPAAGAASPALDHDAVLAVVREAVVTVLEVEPASVTRDTDLVADLGADSLALVEVVEIVEERLAPLARPGFHVEDDDLETLTTVGAAVDYALARL